MARREQAAKLAAEPGVAGEMHRHHLCASCEALGPSGVVINEAIRNIPTVLAQMPRTEPGTLVGLAGAGLGFSASVALGLKLAMSDRIVMPIMGDGTFYFSNPQSVLAVSQNYGLPIFIVVLDNSGWGAVKEATLRVYPAGEAKAANDYGAASASTWTSARLPKRPAHTASSCPSLRRRRRDRPLPGGRALWPLGGAACQGDEDLEERLGETRMKDLAGKTAFVTGAASGIGFGIASALAQAGVKVMLCDIEEAALRRRSRN